MAGRGATNAQTNLAEVDVELVVNDSDILGSDLVEADYSLYCLAAQIHERRGLDSDDLRFTDPPFRQIALKIFLLDPRFHICHLGDEIINTVEADVVPGIVVLFADVSQANEQNRLVLAERVELDGITCSRHARK